MPAPDTHEISAPRRPFGRGRRALAAAGLLALGVVAGAGVVAETRPSVTMAPTVPVAIRSVSSGGIVTIRGRVAEIYGNKFILADASGRALVDTGREGDRGQLVTAGEPVTIQGRFDRGFMHAAFLIGPDAKVIALGPLGGPRHGPGGRHGAGHDRDHGFDGPPPPADETAPSAPATGVVPAPPMRQHPPGVRG